MFEVINYFELPHDAQDVWDGFGRAGIHGFRLNGEFVGVSKQIQQVRVLADGFNAVREWTVDPSVTCGFNAGWRQKYELFRTRKQIHRVFHIVQFHTHAAGNGRTGVVVKIIVVAVWRFCTHGGFRQPTLHGFIVYHDRFIGINVNHHHVV